MSEWWNERGKDCIRLGHRGASGNPREGENTISSFEEALRRGAHGFEFDVRRAKCESLVIIHDATIDRTTNGKGKVCDYTAQELEEFDAGFEDYIPTLEEVLVRYMETTTRLNIELKESGLAQDVKQMIEKWHVQEQVLVSCFDSDDHDNYSDTSWDDLRVFSPSIRTGLLVGLKKVIRCGDSRLTEEARARNAYSINPHVSVTYPYLIRKAHACGIKVISWTVNRPFTIEQLKLEAVDGLISDFPERLL